MTSIAPKARARPAEPNGGAAADKGRSRRVGFYLRPKIQQYILEIMEAHDFTSKSDAVTQAIVMMRNTDWRTRQLVRKKANTDK